MSPQRSRFKEEVAIIPPVATLIAIVVFAVVQICLLWLVPAYVRPSELPPRLALVLISLFGGAFAAIIIMLIGYVNADSKRRGMNSLLWTLLVIFVPKALGFLLYFLLRKPLLMPCASCGTSIGSDFRFCPKCGHAVLPICAHCGRSISPDYVCCPYCGKTVGPTATP